MSAADYEMTQISDQYTTLAGKCTIRRMNEDYAEMMPKDTVEVSHKKHPEDVSDLAVEYLIVKGMMTGSLRDLVRAHKDGMDHMGDTYFWDMGDEEVIEYISEFYDNETSGGFVAIYFN